MAPASWSGKMPVQGEIGASRAVVDFEEIALRLEQVEAKIVRYLQHAGVLVGIGGHEAQGAQVVQQAGCVGDLGVQADEARGLLRDGRCDYAMYPDFA